MANLTPAPSPGANRAQTFALPGGNPLAYPAPAFSSPVATRNPRLRITESPSPLAIGSGGSGGGGDAGPTTGQLWPL